MTYSFLPLEFTESLQEGYLVPPHWRKYQLHEAIGMTQELEWGIAVIQTVQVNGFWISYQILQVIKEGILTYQCHTETAILSLLIKGALDIRTDESLLIYFGEQQFGLSYHIQDQQVDWQLKNGECHLFQISFSPRLLSLLLGTTADDIRLKAQTSFSGWFSSFFPINKSADELLKRALFHAHRLQQDIIPLNTSLLQLLDRFAKAYLQQEKNKRWNEKKEWQMSSLELFIEEHLDIDVKAALKPSRLAQSTRTNLYQFKKLFAQHYGLSLAQLIRKKRMEKALQLLTNSSLSPGEVYLQVGYSDFSSFSRAFHQYFGYPPSQINKN